MRVTLLGCGRMGRAAAWGLSADDRVDELTLVDQDEDRAHALAGWLADRSTSTVMVRSDPGAAIHDRDAVAMAMPWADTQAALDVAVAAGVPVASITRPPQADLPALHAASRAAGTPLLLPVGLEPGLTELLAARLAARLDRVEEVVIRCGCVPERPRGPLRHVAFFGGELPHHLPIAQRPAAVTRHGQVAEVPRFSGLETVRIAEVGRLEAYHDGMTPWLAEHPALRGADCTQKTLRWPGFAGTVITLAELGLLADEPVDVDGVAVRPRRLVERVLAPPSQPQPGEPDVVVLEVVVRGWRSGRRTGRRCRLLDRYDRSTGLSAVARTTGLTLAAAVVLLGQGAVAGTGWCKPHLALGPDEVDQILSRLTAAGARWWPDEETDPALTGSGRA